MCKSVTDATASLMVLEDDETFEDFTVYVHSQCGEETCQSSLWKLLFSSAKDRLLMQRDDGLECHGTDDIRNIAGILRVMADKADCLAASYENDPAYKARLNTS